MQAPQPAQRLLSVLALAVCACAWSACGAEPAARLGNTAGVAQMRQQLETHADRLRTALRERPASADLHMELAMVGTGVRRSEPRGGGEGRPPAASRA